MAEMDASGIADQMILLQVKGCHNINWVSPTHYVPQLVEALVLAVERGLNIPIVYNTNAYDSLDTLEVLEDIVDIYLPDTKYSSDTFAKKYSQVADYVEVSRIAIREMHRQVGDLVLAENGVAERGLIVRHLILPNGIAGSRETMEWISSGLSPIVTLSVMSQYFPSHKAHQYMELSRSINLDEYLEVVDLLDTLGMEEGWLQEMSSSENYQPDFSREGHPFEPTR
jgi:putative pyruvate formate lyase activating enzyme